MDESNMIGAIYLGNGRCLFRVWAPLARQVEVHIVSPFDKPFLLEKEERGYHSSTIDMVEPGYLYFYNLDGKLERPDPASRFQPRDVHGPSQIMDQTYPWEDENWLGIHLEETIFYELHVGTFTPEGTFEAIIPRLPELSDLGVNCIELMPICQFPGSRNWGYDGVYPFSVHRSYGGPEGLKRLINACHKKGLAVTLDVVYNHLGPEGNYVRDFGPYSTSKYQTPWGEAINFDDAFSDEVRNFFIESAIFWFRDFHVDALRLDAVHAIYDMSAVPFLKDLSERVEKFWTQEGRKRYLIAESDLNDSRLIRPINLWGSGLDAQWCDDFHHSLHTLLTHEQQGYYADFGSLHHLSKCLTEGYVYSGQYSYFRNRRYGNLSADIPFHQFVVASQNHDQIGNRMLGERISTLVSFEAQKLAAGAVILSPYLPFLFMGEEYGEDAPFLYFVSHTDPELIAAVREGRKREFEAFIGQGDPPDPASPETFNQSKLDWEKRSHGRHRVLLEFYRTLIRLRHEIPAFCACGRDHLYVKGVEAKSALVMRRWWGESDVFCLFNFSTKEVELKLSEFKLEATWRKIIDSSEDVWRGPGTLLSEKLAPDTCLTIRPQSIAVYTRIPELHPSKPQ